MLIFKKLTRFLRMHLESWFEQTEQDSIDEIAIITFGQLVIVVRSTIGHYHHRCHYCNYNYVVIDSPIFFAPHSCL